MSFLASHGRIFECLVCDTAKIIINIFCLYSYTCFFVFAFFDMVGWKKSSWYCDAYFLYPFLCYRFKMHILENGNESQVFFAFMHLLYLVESNITISH